MIFYISHQAHAVAGRQLSPGLQWKCVVGLAVQLSTALLLT